MVRVKFNISNLTVCLILRVHPTRLPRRQDHKTSWIRTAAVTIDPVRFRFTNNQLWPCCFLECWMYIAVTWTATPVTMSLVEPLRLYSTLLRLVPSMEQPLLSCMCPALPPPVAPHPALHGRQGPALQLVDTSLSSAIPLSQALPAEPLPPRSTPHSGLT